VPHSVRLDLRALQAEFRSHVLGGEAPALAAVACGPASIAPAARLQVYRNHVVVSLTAALAATFSAVERLVGEAFFRAMARAYIVANPPGGPCLVEYGETFPGFIAQYDPARALGYLADVARLEWAINEVLHAPRGPAVSAAELAAVPADRGADIRLRLHPAVRVLESPWPVRRIHQAAAADDTQLVDADAGPDRVLVFRSHEDVAMAEVGPGGAAFYAALTVRTSLEAAAEAGLRADPAFDLAVTLQQALALSLLQSAER
jgi:hypothetical protein